MNRKNRFAVKLLNLLGRASYRVYYFTRCKENLMMFGYMPETLKCRNRLAEYCVGNGLEIGHGGFPINDSVITVDLKEPHIDFGLRKTNYVGDAADLSWLSDNSMDYIYSSHVLEDFEDTFKILQEWVRVLKTGGRLVLYLPDQPTYLQYCRDNGNDSNFRHKIPDFSLDYIRQIVNKMQSCRIIHGIDKVDEYSFEVVIEKAGPGTSAL